MCVMSYAVYKKKKGKKKKKRKRKRKRKKKKKRRRRRRRRRWTNREFRRFAYKACKDRIAFLSMLAVRVVALEYNQLHKKA